MSERPRVATIVLHKIGETHQMPRKVRELVRDLTKAGFVESGGKGSHRRFKHTGGAKVTVSGNLGADAKAYQELEVTRAIQESQR